MILILTRADDYHHTHAVVEMLKRKGARHIRFETGGFPMAVQLTLAYGGVHLRQSLTVDGQRLDLDDVRTVWNRRPLPPMPSAALASDDQTFVRAEARQVLRGLWHLLADRFWVNPYLADRTAHAKPWQLRVAQDVGLTVPRTLVTNDAAEAVAFFEQCGGDVVYKTFTGYVKDVGHTGYGIYTNRVSQSHLQRHLDGIALSPCQFQEYLPKQHDLRVTVIGRECFSCEIHSQEHASTVDDWRRSGPDWRRLRHESATLPADVREQVLALMDRLGLVFGCLDFVVTTDGRLMFLEINPNGQWLWIEHAAGLPLLDHFTEMLMTGTAASVA